MANEEEERENQKAEIRNQTGCAKAMTEVGKQETLGWSQAQAGRLTVQFLDSCAAFPSSSGQFAVGMR
jgi:hypothetical protein